MGFYQVIRAIGFSVGSALVASILAAHELAGAEFTEHGVTIEKDLPWAAVMVRVDAELLRQALLNLLLNAMQAMPDGGVVRASVRRDQRIAIVEIADIGLVGDLFKIIPELVQALA